MVVSNQDRSTVSAHRERGRDPSHDFSTGEHAHSRTARGRKRAARRIACAAALALLLGCSDRTRVTDRRPASLPAQDPAPVAMNSDDTQNWASRIGQPVLPKSNTKSPGEVKIEPATLADPEYASHELIPVRRLVYRVTLLLRDARTSDGPRPAPGASAPEGLTALRVPAGELQMDISEQRLRARFIGPGWPVDEGSEVRLRSDVPGVYLFDGDGGRPLGPGALGSWFHGQAGLRARTEIELRHDLGPPDEGPGNLLCALMAEWSQFPRDEMMSRCTGSVPPGFRFGPWSGELTALVPLMLPRSQLRADAVALPAPLATANVRAMLDASDLARIRPLSATSAAGGGDSIEVDNRGPTRVALIVQGMPIGWVKAQSRGSMRGLAPGSYRVAGLRPNGQLVAAPSVIQLPARLAFGPKELDSAQLKEPLLSSPDAAR